MTAATEWEAELGVGPREATTFFGSTEELDEADVFVPQEHVIRRAFDLLGLDGVLCGENAPLVYFKSVKQIDPKKVGRLHRDFWNHGGAPLLVLIDSKEVQIYSGLSRPGAANETAPSLVETLHRASVHLREFLPSVESGEFFRRHAKSFDPEQRVDRDLLKNLQETRRELLHAMEKSADPGALDGLLCRLVFTCYLFDREVIGPSYLREIGLDEARHLRDVLALHPRSEAKRYLYKLFEKLGEDFNGDLFNDDLGAEADVVRARHIDLLERFFNATDARGQQTFWPYDFGIIPVETISAIYERFLKQTKETGAFYTPRFLAEVVLDTALVETKSLIGKRFLDPACGSGIFLVGVFNRLAEEWKQANPDARNDRRARELMQLLQSSLFGIDINPTACRITAFSLYLAYLDQLLPRDIQELQKKRRALPKLVAGRGFDADGGERVIWCGDFFEPAESYPCGVDFVVGNPPWGAIAGEGSLAAEWCKERQRPIPGNQISAAFVWKSANHAAEDGRVCLVLPTGTLFNHGSTAVEFQKVLFKQHAVERVLNLADYQRFLFEEAEYPALVVCYRRKAPAGNDAIVEYWTPKADWMVTRAEVITIGPEDRSRFRVQELLRDLDGIEAPTIWKRYLWATPRDWRLLDRLSLFPRLRDHVRQPKDQDSEKRWLMAEGFQPFGVNDKAQSRKRLKLPTDLFIPATAKALDLFLLEGECKRLSSDVVETRRVIRNTDIFLGPHVLVSQGFTSIAFADFDVSFRHALRGIHGPRVDRDLLLFLTAYLRSDIARYYLFHTSSNWGVSRQKVHVEELLRLPFPLPQAMDDAKRAKAIVKEVAGIVSDAADKAGDDFADRAGLVRSATAAIGPLLDAYFDILPVERVLVEDTVKVSIPSVRPTRERRVIGTVVPSTEKQREQYIERLCATLNGWSKRGTAQVYGYSTSSANLGMAMAVLQRGDGVKAEDHEGMLEALEAVRKSSSRKLNALELARGVKVFDRNRLYVVKPIGRRFWTETAALNDADEIASTILMQRPPQVVA